MNRFQTISKGWFICLLSIIAIGCADKKEDEKIAAIIDRDSIPMMHSTDITTIISDSGVTRFRITTPQWDDYDKTNPPHWEFPCGIVFERFNEKLVVDANIHSQYAYYNKSSQVWELRGNVKATNLLGEHFETPQLFWDQRSHKFYSDSTIKITQVSQIIMGVGFDSDESMSRYNIRKYKGSFAVDENKEATSTTKTQAPTPSTSPALPAKQILQPPTNSAKIAPPVNKQPFTKTKKILLWKKK